MSSATDSGTPRLRPSFLGGTIETFEVDQLFPSIGRCTRMLNARKAEPGVSCLLRRLRSGGALPDGRMSKRHRRATGHAELSVAGDNADPVPYGCSGHLGFTEAGTRSEGMLVL